ncbi:MAG: MEDS domain-containing protein [Actinomycetota bacterium]|nr:MEDS domain-containing protein [Actinomycetota bacterium]
MAAHLLADSLRAARVRLGWSREALAYHSGVSWSAIAQIESGRRKDVRLITLSALAEALDVSVDYLIGTTLAIPPRLFEHRVLVYRSDEEYLGVVVPFLADGIEQSHCLLAVTTEAKTALLREALADRSEQVEFVDWANWYPSPQEALSRYGAFVKEKFEAGAVWIRIVAEAGWTRRTEAEIAAWTRYESLVNLAFSSAPATIICTYDERSFPEDVIADACCTHPEVAQYCGVTASPTFRKPEDFLLEPQAASIDNGSHYAS